MLDDLRASGSRVRVLFLDARTDVLIRRYESTRRRHPASAGRPARRGHRAGARTASTTCGPWPTSSSTPATSTSTSSATGSSELFADDDDAAGMQVTVLSFGFKHGLPADVDMVLDCRFLPNPHWVDELRPQTGQDAAGARLRARLGPGRTASSTGSTACSTCCCPPTRPRARRT